MYSHGCSHKPDQIYHQRYGARVKPSLRGTIEEKGKVALDAKIFYEIIRRLPDNDVTIKTDDKYAATITCEKLKFNIPGKSREKILLVTDDREG